MRLLKRIILAGIVLIGLLLIVPAVGFQFWLSNQHPRMQSTMSSFEPGQQWLLLQDFFFPPELEDHGALGRRQMPGRGHTPWAFRTSLDGRPRILNLALAPKTWLAYATETGTIHQFWQGDLALEGAVYDAQHGLEPTSVGAAWARPEQTQRWEIASDEAWSPASISWQAWGIDPDTGRAWLRYQLTDATGASVTILESPELGDSTANTVTLERTFTATPLGAPAARLPLLAGATTTVISPPATKRTNPYLVLRPEENAEPILLQQTFDRPEISILAATERDNDKENLLRREGCQSCHHGKEQIVGPSWRAIAARYNTGEARPPVAELATRIIQGSRGRWGQVPMQPHPALLQVDAENLVRQVFAFLPTEDPIPDPEEAQWTMGFQTEPRPTQLHPALSSQQIRPTNFTPQTGGLALLSDGRLGIATWDRDGAVYAVGGWAENDASISVERIAEGLHEPLGLAAVDGRLFVMQKQELTELIDRNHDGWYEEHRNLNNQWGATSNFHEFGFGLAFVDGYLYLSLGTCVLAGGDTCPIQHPDRGKLLRVSIATGEREFVASGFRTPNGVAPGPGGAIFVTDNQGSWLPASKLVQAEFGDDFGWRAPGDDTPQTDVRPPALWLPQNEIGNSPTQPLVLQHGPYAGHILFGDIFNGGLKRAWLETVDGQLQGVAFHFSGGLAAPVNRLLETPDGTLLVGEIGSRGNWGDPGKPFFGLEALRFSEEIPFEPLEIHATPNGFRIVFSQAIATTPKPEWFSIRQWSYRPDRFYGGPKYNNQSLPITEVDHSPGGHEVEISIEGLRAGTIAYLHIDKALTSAGGNSLWINEAWYTQNARPKTLATPHNTLSAAEESAGWRLLFDGKTFAGWKIYGSEAPISGWEIRQGSLAFTRKVSMAGMIWNHLNPLAQGALDLITEETFGNFELRFDWKIEPGGNSGVIYAIPDEESYLVWKYGLEMQILDDAGHSDGNIDKRRAGDLYDLKASRVRAAHPPGRWNQASIRVVGEDIQHTLNGATTLQIRRGSPEWEAAFAASKFSETENFGRALRGHIALQDHGDLVRYRNMKIREIP